MEQIVKKIAKKIINNFGYDITRNLTSHLYSQSMEGGIYRCKNRDIEISTVIDVGASNGCWTKLCMKYYPKSYYFLIEAQQPHEKALIDLKNKYANISYVISAAGNRQGQIYFDVKDLWSGLASEKPFEKNCIKVPVTTIDNEVNIKHLIAPFLIKLDTHGYEVPILEGAKDTLNECNMIILEAYNFKLTKDSLRFYEICQYLEDKGFYPIDIVDLTLRPYDFSLWQMDIFFIRSDRKEFTFNKYKDECLMQSHLHKS